MEKIRSKFDDETIYKVTDKAVTISRNGDELKIPIGLIPQMSAPFIGEIQAELFEFYDKKYPEVPCPVCNKPMRQFHNKKYCSPECQSEANNKKRKRTCAEETAKKREKGLEKECAYCGEKFILYDNFHTKYCSPECKKGAATKQRNTQRSTTYQEKKKKKRKSQLDNILKEARSKGLSYADIQKQETLAMVGGIKI